MANNVFNINSSGTYTFYVRDEKGCVAELIAELEFLDIEIPNYIMQ